MVSRTTAHLTAWLAALMIAVPVGAEPGEIAKQAREWRAQHEREILAEFVEFLAIPNLASDIPNIRRNAEALRAMCEKRGLSTQLLTLEGAPPIVVADLVAPNAKRTIAFYAHYDGQPVEPARWKTDPWKPTMRDAAEADIDWQKAGPLDPELRLYARAAGDDKGPIIAMLAALDVLRATARKPAANIRFVFEGEEEAGSPNLGAYLEKYPEKLRPDAWILCDGPVHQSRRQQLFFGARGITEVDLTVYGPVKGLHDGHYGNWVRNPVVGLAHLINSIRDETGRILIKGFYDEVQPPTAAELEALKRIPNVEPELRREFQIGAVEGDGKPLNELLMLPALNLRGIEAARVGAQASNTIPTEARASIDFRLVPKQTPASVRDLFERHLVAEGCTIVRETPNAETRRAHGNRQSGMGKRIPARAHFA